MMGISRPRSDFVSNHVCWPTKQQTMMRISAHWINTMNTGLVCEIIALKMKKHSPVHLNAWTMLSCTPKTRQKTKLKKLRWMLGGVHIMEKFVIVRWSSPPLPDCKRWGNGKQQITVKQSTHLRPPNTPQSSSYKMTVSTRNYRETRIEFRSLTFEKFREMFEDFDRQF